MDQSPEGIFWFRIDATLTELVFINLSLEILYWIYKIATHSRGFIWDFPTKIDLWNLYNSFLVCKEGFVYSFMIIFGGFVYCLTHHTLDARFQNNKQMREPK
jgi:hypothetical protein